MLQAVRSRVRDTMRRINFFIYLILTTALGPGVYSASNRNEYQKHTNNVPGDRLQNSTKDRRFIRWEPFRCIQQD
jgi:hypothetical protein